MSSVTTTPGDRIAADTSMGPVTLLVGDLDAMTAFYRDAITLEVLRAEGDVVELGRAGRPIVVLRRAPSLRHATPGRQASSTPRSSSSRGRPLRPPCSPSPSTPPAATPAAPTTP